MFVPLRVKVYYKLQLHCIKIFFDNTWAHSAAGEKWQTPVFLPQRLHVIWWTTRLAEMAPDFSKPTYTL